MSARDAAHPRPRAHAPAPQLRARSPSRRAQRLERPLVVGSCTRSRTRVSPGSLGPDRPAPEALTRPGRDRGKRADRAKAVLRTRGHTRFRAGCCTTSAVLCGEVAANARAPPAPTRRRRAFPTTTMHASSARSRLLPGRSIAVGCAGELQQKKEKSTPATRTAARPWRSCPARPCCSLSASNPNKARPAPSQHTLTVREPKPKGRVSSLTAAPALAQHLRAPACDAAGGERVDGRGTRRRVRTSRARTRARQRSSCSSAPRRLAQLWTTRVANCAAWCRARRREPAAQTRARSCAPARSTHEPCRCPHALRRLLFSYKALAQGLANSAGFAVRDDRMTLASPGSLEMRRRGSNALSHTALQLPPPLIWVLLLVFHAARMETPSLHGVHGRRLRSCCCCCCCC